MLLAEDQEFAAARAQFKAAAKADEYHLPVWQAWAVMELKLQNYEKARQLFQRGVWAAPKDPNLAWLWQVRPATRPPSVFGPGYACMHTRGSFSSAACMCPSCLFCCTSTLPLRPHDCSRVRATWAAGISALQFASQPCKAARGTGVCKSRQNAWGACVQAWGCMEAELGNLPQARGLFKAAVSLAPESDATWEAWIKMEEENDLLGRANALRSHRFEVAERNALPSSFSTLPAEGGAVVGTVRPRLTRGRVGGYTHLCQCRCCHRIAAMVPMLAGVPGVGDVCACI